jgi:Tfp pilus assembly protein PilV
LKRKRSKARARVAGFTLLEVVLSIAILSYALVSLVVLQNQGVDLSIHSSNMTMATMMAKEKMSELMLKEKGYDMIADRRKTFADEFTNFVVKGEVIEDALLPIELTVGVKELRVTVTWQERGGDEEISLVTYVLKEQRTSN